MKSLLRPLLAVVATAWLIVAPPVSAEPVGSGTGGTPFATTHLFDPGLPGWVIGGPADPIGITAVPEHAPWIKQLLFPPTAVGPLIPFSTVFTVTEHLRVGQPGFPGPEWTDWHEHILGEGWDWEGGTILASGVPLPGLQVSLGDPGLPPDLGHSPNIWFDFNPVAPGTELTIIKQIHCHLINGCLTQIPIQIAEYPTIRVPEPATLALLGAGLLAALGLRSRRTRHAV